MKNITCVQKGVQGAMKFQRFPAIDGLNLHEQLNEEKGRNESTNGDANRRIATYNHLFPANKLDSHDWYSQSPRKRESSWNGMKNTILRLQNSAQNAMYNYLFIENGSSNIKKDSDSSLQYYQNGMIKICFDSIAVVNLGFAGNYSRIL